MRTVRWMLAAVLVAVAISACERRAPAPPVGPEPRAAFAERAADLVRLWHDARPQWAATFIPLAGRTLAPASGFPDEKTKLAFENSRYTGGAGLPATGGHADVVYPDGSRTPVEVLSAAAAYREFAETMWTVPCDTSHKLCTSLEITGATLTSAPIVTTRGKASAPAWAYTIRGLSDPVIRIAVAPQGISPAPRIAAPPIDGYRLLGVQEFGPASGDRVEYRLGVGACDKGIEPLFAESDEIVVLGGLTAPPKAGGCTNQMIYHPVSVTLTRPLGGRLVVDGLTGQLILPPEWQMR